MIQPSDLFTWTTSVVLKSDDEAEAYAVITYQISDYTDLRNLEATRKYLVVCTQRLLVANPTPYVVGPESVSQFHGYPALLGMSIDLDAEASQNVGAVELLDYSPRTLNTAVMQSRSTDSSSSSESSQSRQHTTGSSTSQTNSYGGSANLGFFGDDPTGGISGDFGFSSTTTSSSSSTRGSSRSTGRGQNTALSAAMTLKDWGGYALIDEANRSAHWIWGQEYPWNVIQFKNGDEGSKINLPAFVQNRLYDGKQAYPPSELSLFGVDFVAKAVWLVTPKPGVADLVTVRFDHGVTLCMASHGVDDKKGFFAEMNVIQPPIPATPVELDLDLLGLGAIEGGTAYNGAVIGFIPDKFVVPPVDGSPFKIASEVNNLLITGSGFAAPMSTEFAHGPAKLTIYFKIADTDTDYALHLKHWKTTPTGSTLTIVANGNDPSPIVKHVDALEAEGGERNLLSIVLRNRDYSSEDFHDYLQLGLNRLDITIEPDDGQTGSQATAGYALRALAIG